MTDVVAQTSFITIMKHYAQRLLDTPPIHTGQWQSKDVSSIPQMATYEIMDTTVTMAVPLLLRQWREVLGRYPNYDWAGEHFLERVGGVPLNPPPSHVHWPWARYNGNHQTGDEQQFSHTYPERIWPRYAGHGDVMPIGTSESGYVPNRGIRFEYGDLQDVVDLLVRTPLTRQAYLPIWFPEDTGVAHGQRVPCTLGYHFMIRDGRLSCRYYIRSCDLVRHFADDIYMAGRLMQWVSDRVRKGIREADVTDGWIPPLAPGNLVMHIASLHAFTGDDFKLRQLAYE